MKIWKFKKVTEKAKPIQNLKMKKKNNQAKSVVYTNKLRKIWRSKNVNKKVK